DRGRRGLCPGPEGEPRDLAPRGHRSHRRTTRGGPDRCAGACDDGEGAWARGAADLSPAPGPQGVARVPAVGGAEVDRGGDVVLPPRREGGGGSPLLPQQPGRGRRAVCPGRSGPLGYRERLSLEPGYDVSRG